MTRKDYIAIAAAIKSKRNLFADNAIGGQRSYSLFAVDELAADLAGIMAADNPRFDRQRFLKACGVA